MNILCSKVEAESKNVIGMIGLRIACKCDVTAGGCNVNMKSMGSTIVLLLCGSIQG